MTKRLANEIIVGLDIGTSKVLAVVAEVKENQEIEILGVGQHASKGLRKGVVANIDSTVQSIQQAIEEAELTAECRISSVYAGIAGAHITSMNSSGVAAIKNRDEVSAEDVERVLDAAQAQAIPNDQQVLHILPQDFIIDGQDGIREPIGMSGVRLEAKVHIITGAVSAAQNIVKCITRCGLDVEEIVLEQVASSYAVLDDDETELGVAMVDIGGGTTDIAVFTDGAIRHTAVLPVAGDHAIKAAMKATSAKVEGELAEAEQAKAEAEAELEALTSSLGDAGAEAEAIIADAREQATRLEADLIARAENDVAEAKERARIEVAAQRDQALANQSINILKALKVHVCI